MRVRIGTSGYSYVEWRGTFYPEDLPPAKMLAYYAERLDAVEINNTFYRMPSPSMVAQWTERTPPSFRFVLKAPQRITHQKRLRDCADAVAALERAAEALGDRRGPTLFQLPPNLKKDLPRLADFLALLPAAPAAFEFRHASWFDDAVFDALRARGLALCIAESEDLATPLVATARFGTLRLRRQDYVDADVAAWADRIRAQPWDEAYVFFKHEDSGAGPALAAKLREFVGPGASP